jgi:hypothetical protein
MAPNGWKMLDMPPRFNELWRESSHNSGCRAAARLPARAV